MASHEEPHALLFSTDGAATRSEPVGEVIEATTVDFVAQACQLDGAPPFGSFVHAVDQHATVFGVVAHVQTAGIDPGARPIMRGHGDVRDDRIYLENPDLPYVLRTTFRALVVGYAEAGVVHQVLPPRPPRLHYSVWPSPPDEVRRFTDAGLAYLRTLLSAGDLPADELLAANVRLAAQLHGEPLAFARQAGRELAQLLRTDYGRLSSILRRLAAAPPGEPA